MDQNINSNQKTIDNQSNSNPQPMWQKYTIPFLITFFVIGSGIGLWYWINQQKYIYTDRASISAPLIIISPHTQGKLKKITVNNGDYVLAYQTIAIIGSETIKTSISGIILTINQDIGREYHTGETIATMINPDEMKIIAQVEEDKGLKEVHPGQTVFFTVDAFGSQKFSGTVESISDTNHASDVVFNISDKRQEQQFDIKIKYDQNQNPQFQNGLSAKVWIVKS